MHFIIHAVIKLNYVSERGPWCLNIQQQNKIFAFLVLCAKRTSGFVGSVWGYPPHKRFAGALSCHPSLDNAFERLDNAWVNNREAGDSLQWRHNGHLKSPASRLFTQPFIEAQIKENIKAPRHWLLWGEFTGDSPHKWPVTRKMFHLMTSSCWDAIALIMTSL